MNTGRPTEYREEYCAALFEHMSGGFSFESFAPSVGVHRDTLYEWAKVHPAFSDAKKAGTDASLFYYEKIFKAGIMGKIKNFNAASLIFLMKNRFKWTDRNEQEINVAASLHKQLVDAMKEQE
jgi:hypothetical protein